MASSCHRCPLDQIHYYLFFCLRKTIRRESVGWAFGALNNLHLMALDPNDLALSKLERNNQRDRDDVRFLARSVPFNLDILQERYTTELRWQLGVPKREDLTMQLWLDAIREDRGISTTTSERESD